MSRYCDRCDCESCESRRVLAGTGGEETLLQAARRRMKELSHYTRLAWEARRREHEASITESGKKE